LERRAGGSGQLAAGREDRIVNGEFRGLKNSRDSMDQGGRQRAGGLIGDPRDIVGGCGGNARDSFKAFHGEEVLIPGSDVVGGLR